MKWLESILKGTLCLMSAQVSTTYIAYFSKIKTDNIKLFLRASKP